MKQYMLSVIHPDDAPPAPEVLDKIGRDVDQVNDEIRAQGAWVFGTGLGAPSTATVVQEKSGQIVTTDGPFVETKEYVGGFWIIKVPDLDAALEWAKKATRACRVPIEVRPLDWED